MLYLHESDLEKPYFQDPDLEMFYPIRILLYVELYLRRKKMFNSFEHSLSRPGFILRIGSKSGQTWS